MEGPPEHARGHGTRTEGKKDAQLQVVCPFWAFPCAAANEDTRTRLVVSSGRDAPGAAAMSVMASPCCCSSLGTGGDGPCCCCCCCGSSPAAAGTAGCGCCSSSSRIWNRRGVHQPWVQSRLAGMRDIPPRGLETGVLCVHPDAPPIDVLTLRSRLQRDFPKFFPDFLRALPGAASAGTPGWASICSFSADRSMYLMAAQR